MLVYMEMRYDIRNVFQWKIPPKAIDLVEQKEYDTVSQMLSGTVGTYPNYNIRQNNCDDPGSRGMRKAKEAIVKLTNPGHMREEVWCVEQKTWTRRITFGKRDLITELPTLSMSRTPDSAGNANKSSKYSFLCAFRVVKYRDNVTSTL